MAVCKICGLTHDQAEFYDSIRTYCKNHWREKVRLNRESKVDYYRAFDRARANNPERVAARAAYAKTEAYEAVHEAAALRWAAKHPDRRAANHAVGSALRAGKLLRQPCWVCGDKAHAHHPDYSRPLDVVWLCPPHHKQAHALVSQSTNSVTQ